MAVDQALRVARRAIEIDDDGVVRDRRARRAMVARAMIRS